MNAGINADQGRATRYLARVNLEIVKAASTRRQAHGRGAGARLPASLAGAPVQLVNLKARRPDGGSEAVTLLGYQTARRRLPEILAALGADDPRLAAAQMLADAAERVGAVKGADWQGADSNGEISDGGATTKVKHAARLRMIEALANGWPIDRRHGPQRAAVRVALAVKRKGSQRQPILAFAALSALCVDGLDLGEILRRSGWSAQAFNRNPLRDALLVILDDVAEGLGLGRMVQKKVVDAN